MGTHSCQAYYTAALYLEHWVESTTGGVYRGLDRVLQVGTAAIWRDLACDLMRSCTACSVSTVCCRWGISGGGGEGVNGPPPVNGPNLACGLP